MIHLHNMDCMIAMKGFESDYFDLSIVDPPYGIGFDGNSTSVCRKGINRGFSKKQHHKKKHWDKVTPSQQYFDELLRVSKNVIIWGGNYFADKLPPSRGWIYWDKKISNRNEQMFSDGELAYTSFNIRLKKFTYDWIGVGYINNPDKQKKIHPTEKPIALYKWLFSTYSESGQRILDTHLGSASSAIAAYQSDMNLEFYGYEIDKEYFDSALNRFNEVKRQVRLFA